MPTLQRPSDRTAPLAAGTLLVAAAVTTLVTVAVGALATGRPSALAPQPLVYAAALDRGLHVVDYATPGQSASTGDSQRVVPSVDVAASGNIVYVAAGAEGLGVFDIRDPKVPFPYQTLSTPRYAATRLAVDGVRLYALDPAAGVRIFDVTDPYDPKLKGDYHEPGQIWTGMAASGDLLVVLGAGRLRTVDVSDPAKATALGELARGGADVTIRGGLAYVADEAGMAILDLRRPKAPTVLGESGFPQGARLSSPRVLVSRTRGRDLAWVGGGFNGSNVGAVVTWDIAKPTSPAAIDVLRFGAAVQSLASDGDVLGGLSPTEPGELLFVGTAANLHTAAWLDSAPDKPQILGMTAGLVDASVTGLVVDPRERAQATPTAQSVVTGQGCVDAEADAWVSVGTRGVNHGADPELRVGAGGQDVSLSYIRFKLGLVPADADIVSATLQAELLSQTGSSPFILQSVVDAADAAWDEATITFLNRPAHSGLYAAPGIDAKAGVKTLDITQLGIDWHVGKRPNHGLVVSSENTATNPIESRFASRESTRAAPPRLCVGWTRDVTATPAPSTGTPTAAPTRTVAPSSTPSPATTATAGASPTGEGQLPTQTAVPTSDATRRPTRTAMPTGQPTDRPSATHMPKPVGGGFGRPDAGAPLPLRKIRRLRFGPGGELWARVPDARGGPDTIVTRIPRRGWRMGTIEDVIAERFDDLLSKGTVPDFFAADARRRIIWAGANFFDGQIWHRLVTDENHPGGTLRHDQRTLLDRNGLAWVPFEGATECANPTGCASIGVRAFDADRGALGSLDIDAVPEMLEYNLEGLLLVKGEAPSGNPTLSAVQGHERGGVFARLGRWLGIGADGAPVTGALRSTSAGSAGSASPAGPAGAASVAAADDVYAVSPAALYVLPDTATAIRYPFLPSIEDAGGETRNAGYATTATTDLAGRLVVFTWIERHEGRALAYQIIANTWLGAAWDTLDLTTGSPLLIDGSAEFLRLSAAVFAPDGTLWLGTSDGQVAAFNAGTWSHHFTASNSPLYPDEPISALTVSDSGALWIAQPSGLLIFGGTGDPAPPATIYLPRVQKP